MTTEQLELGTDMSANVRSISLVQERAINGLLAHGSPTRASKEAGVNERTIRRWLDSEPFMTEYKRRSRLKSKEAAIDLLAAQREAVSTLREGMASGSPATRVRAARTVLEMASRWIDDDLELRITDLERRASELWQGDTKRLA